MAFAVELVTAVHTLCHPVAANLPRPEDSPLKGSRIYYPPLKFPKVYCKYGTLVHGFAVPKTIRGFRKI
jgi:hypothetical protein